MCIRDSSNTGATSRSTLEARRLTRQLTALNKEIVIQWIPSHIDISGNETADTLAKRGTKLYHRESTHDFSTLRRLMTRKTNSRFLEEARNISERKPWSGIEQLWNNNCRKPRKEAVANFRLETGHDCLSQFISTN